MVQRTDGVEFFVHSPFAERTDAGEVIDRNDCSLVMHAWFQIEGREAELRFNETPPYPASYPRVSAFDRSDGVHRVALTN